MILPCNSRYSFIAHLLHFDNQINIRIWRISCRLYVIDLGCPAARLFPITPLFNQDEPGTRCLGFNKTLVPNNANLPLDSSIHHSLPVLLVPATAA